MANHQTNNYLMRKLKEKLFLGMVLAFSIISIIPLISILGYVFFQGFGALKFDFFLNLPKPVGEIGGGMGNAILGTGIILSIACLVGLPFGILGGIWLAEYGHGKRGFLIRYAADVLSGIPSIVIGIFVYVILVLVMRRFSALAGGVALGMIMIPMVMRTTEELIRLVPTTLRESGLALGIPQWKVSLFIVFRTAWSGIFTGIMLAVARAMGETAPLLFTSFNNQFWNVALDQPMASMTVQIFNYAIAPFEDWHAQAWAGSLTLVFLVLAITLVVRRFAKQVTYV